MIYNFIDKTKDEKILRLKIREIAEETLIRYAKKGISDIFDIVENISVLFMRPEENIKLSGLTLYVEDLYMMYINSAFTLGHQRFTAAHELGHIVLHNEELKDVHLLKKNKDLEREANIFATEFLMPVHGVKEIFYKYIDVNPMEVIVDHIIIMHNYFKVSYKAMLKRLVYLELCDVKKYEELAMWCSIDRYEELRQKTEELGYSTDLINKNFKYYLDKEYEIILNKNFTKGLISQRKYLEIIDYMGKTPGIKEDFDENQH